MTLTELLIPAITGLFSGVVGSLFAPWINWGIEKRRGRQKARAELISACRILLRDPPEKNEFRKHPIYSQIKPYLSEKTDAVIYGKFSEYGKETIVVVSGGRGAGVNPYAQDVLDELTELEKKWNLL